MRVRDTCGIALLSCVLVNLPVLHAAERRIARAALPAPVEATVAEQSKGETIQGLSTDTENGKPIYELALSVNGRARDVTIDAQGRILEIEDEVALASLPVAVRQALAAGAGTGTIGKVESLTKNGKLVAYEAVVRTGKRTTEIQVGPDGRTLAHPE